MERRTSTRQQRRRQPVNQQTKDRIKRDIEDDLDEAGVPVNEFQLIYIWSSRSATLIFRPRAENYLEQAYNLSARNLPVINRALFTSRNMQRTKYYSVRRSPERPEEHDDQRMRLRTNDLVFEIVVEHELKSVLSLFFPCFSGIL